MLTKANIESIQVFVSLCYKIAIVLMRFQYLTFVCNRTSCREMYRIIWPITLFISLILTIFGIDYYRQNSEINLIVLLWHWSMFVIKITSLIVYIVYSTQPFEFCQLFNAVIVLSIKRRAMLVKIQSSKSLYKDNMVFSILLIGCALFMI